MLKIKKAMRKSIYTLTIIAILASCSQPVDKKAQLEKLKTQREVLNTQIAALETEINPTGKADAEKPISVKVLPAQGCVFNHYIEVQGVVDGDQNIAVSPQMPGLVTAVYVHEGSNVKKGDVLAELDSKVLQQSLEEVKTQLELATNMFNKQKALWDKNIGSEIQFLQAKAGKESLEKRAITMQEQLALSKITSPINGTIESIPLKVGEMASPGSPYSTIRIINMSTAKITANVAEAYATKVKNGNNVLVRFPDLDKEIDSKLSFTSRFIDPVNRTFKVECKFSTRDLELRANMIATIKIKDYTNEKAFCVPVNYVQTNQDGKFIYLATQRDGRWIAERRMVKTGMDYNGTIEILEGVGEGEKIITSGYQNMKEGKPVIF